MTAAERAVQVVSASLGVTDLALRSASREPALRLARRAVVLLARRDGARLDEVAAVLARSRSWVCRLGAVAWRDDGVRCILGER